MRKSYKIAFIACFIISIVCNGYFLFNKKVRSFDITSITFSKNPKNNLYKSIDSFTSVLSIVDYAYYKDISQAQLMDYAIKGVLENLDPYSTLLDSDSSNELVSYTKGEFYGIGVEVTQNDDKTIEVITPLDDSPAFKAGVLSGDKLIYINDEPVSSMKFFEISQKLRGENGSKVKLTFSRNNISRYTVSLERSLIKAIAVKHQMYGDIGYIKLSEFNEKTTNDLKKSMAKIIKNNNLKGVVLDLRNNPGGLVDQAISVVDSFLNNGKIISLQGRDKSQEKIFTATKGDVLADLPLIVLINGGSASASEIVAGSLQDNSRALVLGTTSFGKGVIQSIIPINDSGIEIKLTTALYYLPKGRTIHNIGVTPDVFIFADGSSCNDCSLDEINILKQKETDYLSKAFDEKQNIEKDYQLDKALELIKQHG